MMLGYESEGHGFDSHGCHCSLAIDVIFLAYSIIALGSTQPLTVLRTMDLSLWGETGCVVKLTTLNVNCLKIWMQYPFVSILRIF